MYAFALICRLLNISFDVEVKNTATGYQMSYFINEKTRPFCLQTFILL